jgi:hypothetical protein
MAWRERKVAANGPDDEPAKSAGFRKNPRKKARELSPTDEKKPQLRTAGASIVVGQLVPVLRRTDAADAEALGRTARAV